MQAFYLSFFFLLFFQVVFSQDISIKTRIIGGRRARENEFPNQVGIVRRQGSKITTCGGTIIDDHWVLTAGHCMLEDRDKNRPAKPEDVTIYLGAVDIKQSREKIEAVKIYVHPDLDPLRKPQTDIAMIRTKVRCVVGSHPSKKGYLGTDNVYTMKATVPFSNKTSYVGKTVWTVGYGKKTNDMSERPDGILQTVDLKVLPDDVCERQYPKGIYNHRFMMCAGDLNGGKGSCNGDSGSPLLLKNDQQDTQVILGLGLFGTFGGCGLKGTGGVYTKVSSFISWIEGVKEQFEEQENKEKTG